MSALDQVNKISRWDRKWQVLASNEKMASQFFQAWQEMKLIRLPGVYARINNVVMAGMGGSGLTAHVIKSLYFTKLNLPLEIVNGYSLPAYVNKDSLVVVTSYSGNTEEALALFDQVLAKRAKILVITTNGRLAKLAHKAKVPLYHFNDSHNPSGRPRLGLGYTLAAQLAILKRLGWIKFGLKELAQIKEADEKYQERFGLANPFKKNPAKYLAKQLSDQAIMVVASEFLVGNAHILANQINESANNFADYFALPEMNHHLIDSFAHPRINRRWLKFLFLESEFYGPENQVRVDATKEILAGNRIGFASYQAKSPSRLSQMFETLLFSAYLSFYLAILNKENPRSDPWVEDLKKRLAKMR
ncbi:MAG: SIS domain-containing protein [bacterium]